VLPERLLPHSVIVQTAGTTTDRYGNIIQDWSDPAETVVRARIEMVLTQNPNEVTNGRDDAASVWRIFTNDAITMRQRVVWGSREFDVDGEVAPQYGLTGPHHYEAILALR
jgi:head-tail adaptor